MTHLSYFYHSEKIYHNWTKQIELCLQVIRGELAPRIVTVFDLVDCVYSDDISGPGGTGKSWFLHRLSLKIPDGSKIDNRKYVHSICFDWLVENFDDILIMNTIINKLTEDNPQLNIFFKNYYNHHSRYQTMRYPVNLEESNTVLNSGEFNINYISHVKDSIIHIHKYAQYLTQDTKIQFSTEELISLRRKFFQCLFSLLIFHPEIILILYFDAVERAGNMKGWFDSLYDHGCSDKIPSNLSIIIASKKRPSNFHKYPTEKIIGITAGYLDFNARKEFLSILEKEFGKIKLPFRISLLLNRRSTYQEFVLYFEKNKPQRQFIYD